MSASTRRDFWPPESWAIFSNCVLLCGCFCFCFCFGCFGRHIFVRVNEWMNEIALTNPVNPKRPKNLRKSAGVKSVAPRSAASELSKCATAPTSNCGQPTGATRQESDGRLVHVELGARRTTDRGHHQSVVDRSTSIQRLLT